LYLSYVLHCRNVKYSANEVLAARADPNCRLFPYGPQTDIYSFGLMLWELVTNQPLFPGFRGKTAKSAITKYVCSGHRPPLSAGWPRSLQTMLSNCWHSDPTQRPKIGVVKRDFQQVLVDLICPDKIGRKVARALWLGQETRKVPYNEFERVFTDITQVDLGTASFCFRRCLSAMLCDSFDNTITFERFCNLLHYFDSLTPIDAFWNRLVTLFDQPWFFGFVPAEDARAMLIEHWRQTRQGYYMMRFSSTQPGSYSLYAIDTTGLLTHWRIGHLYSSEFFIPIDDVNNGNNSATNTQQTSVKPATQKPFSDLLTLHAHCLQLPSMLKDKKAMPGSPCQCFFASNPLASTENL
jgi:serine/threonine protein kinase